MAGVIRVVVETGAKRTFACAIDWPGWYRSGRDEESALAALFECAHRYAQALTRRRIPVPAVKDASAFTVVERVKGNATTDFGAPGAVTKGDARRVTADDLRRLGAFHDACWREFDAIAVSARGRPLRSEERRVGKECRL